MNGEYGLRDSTTVYVFKKYLTAEGKGIYVEVVIKTRAVVHDVCVDACRVGIIVKCI